MPDLVRCPPEDDDHLKATDENTKKKQTLKDRKKVKPVTIEMTSEISSFLYSLQRVSAGNSLTKGSSFKVPSKGIDYYLDEVTVVQS